MSFFFSIYEDCLEILSSLSCLSCLSLSCLRVLFCSSNCFILLSYLDLADELGEDEFEDEVRVLSPQDMMKKDNRLDFHNNFQN